MSFKSVDELFNFDFQDVVIKGVEIIPEGITFTVDALIVEPENTQNENFIKSYADTAKIRFSGGRIYSGVRDGYKRYDANDKLLSEVPDTSLSENEVKTVLEKSNGAYLYAVDRNDESKEDDFYYTISIEFPHEEEFDTNATESYQIVIRFSKAIVTWEKYLNRVQN